ncbi:hypothetical protein EXS71_00345 [Candidatus Uhrbacteria bacterium]|nr:hypothetical protein [Candidatus Uhrbacteria bacterium]
MNKNFSKRGIFSPSSKRGQVREREIEKSLQAIYEDPNGKMPNLSRLDRRPSRRILHIGLSFIIACAVILFGIPSALLFFAGQLDYHEAGLELSIAGPTDISLGENQRYEIHWFNGSSKPLSHVQIRLNAPADFVIGSSEPAFTDPALHALALGILAPGTRGQMIVQGAFTGALGTKNSLQVQGSFRPAGYVRDFGVTAAKTVSYAKSVIEIQTDFPVQAIAGDVVPLRYTVINTGDQPLSNLQAHIRLPTGFVPALATGSISVQQDIYIPLEKNLSAHAPVRFQISGSFAAGVSGDRVFGIEIGRRDAHGNFLAVQKTETRVSVVSGDLTLHLVVNGAEHGGVAIVPGETLHATLGYQNTSPKHLKGLTLQIGFESIINGRSATGTSLISWKTLDDVLSGASSTKSRMQTIRYGKKQIEQLEDLSPQAQGSIDVVIPTLPVASGTHDALIRLTAQGEISAVGEAKVRRTVSAEPLTVQYKSDALFTAQAQYFNDEGVPLGFGPLPPVAGKATAYRVVWNISKKFHPLEQISVSAVLPSIVSWSARTFVDSGSMSYDSVSRTVRWTIDKIPDNAKEVQASFELQLTPAQIDIGRFAALLGATKFQAQDPIATSLISNTQPALTTDLQYDEGAKGKGVVRKE